MSSRHGRSPELRGIGLYNVGPNDPNQLRALNRSRGGVPLDTLVGQVRDIVGLLGSTAVATQWGETVLTALHPHWDREPSAALQDIIVTLAKSQRLLTNSEGHKRHTMHTLVRGLVPPLQALTLDLELYEGTQVSQEFQRCLDWFPKMASESVLTIAKTIHQRMFARLDGPVDLLLALYEEVNRVSLFNGSAVHELCNEIEGRLGNQWSMLYLGQRRFSIAVFRAIADLLDDVRRFKLIDQSFYSLWIPTYEQIQFVLTEIGNEEFESFMTGFVDHPHPSTASHHELGFPDTAHQTEPEVPDHHLALDCIDPRVLTLHHSPNGGRPTSHQSVHNLHGGPTAGPHHSGPTHPPHSSSHSIGHSPSRAVVSHRKAAMYGLSI